MENCDRSLSSIENSITPDMADRILLDKLIAVIGLLFACNIFAAMGVSGPFLTIIRYGLPAIILTRLAARYKATLRVLQSDVFLVILNLIIFASFVWSLQPRATMTGLRGEYVQTVLIALFLATRFSMQQQVRLISVTFGIAALISAFYVAFVPSVGIHQDLVHAGAWKGVFSHKNYFSSVMTLGTASFLVQILDVRERRPWHYWGILMCIALILLSTSKTGQVLLVSILLVLFLYGRYRWQGMKTILVLYGVLMIMLGGVLTLTNFWDQIFIALGRDPTLSGRTLIWDLLRDVYIPQRPLLGYGRGVFWSVGQFSGLAFIPSHAHNGWYDLILDVGLVGFLFYLLSAMQAWRRVLRLAYAARSGAYLWPLALFTIVFINNFTESLMTYLVNIFWPLYMMACWSLKEAIIAQEGYQIDRKPLPRSG
ncbi:MAG: O-antigen ligase family protein [Cyanobacteria bacterium J06639_14]